MIETRIDQMLSLLRDGKILSESTFASTSLVEALRVRELDDQYRYYHDKEIRQRWKILPIHPDVRGAFDDLHELAHSVVAMRIQRYTDPEDQNTHLALADRITHEIDYIAMCRGAQYYTDWYDELWKCYCRNEIPMIEAEPFVKRLIERRNAG
jgi:hypothetical protein